VHNPCLGKGDNGQTSSSVAEAKAQLVGDLLEAAGKTIPVCHNPSGIGTRLALPWWGRITTFQLKVGD